MPEPSASGAIREVALELLVDNELSANAEDTVSFAALQRELSTHGLLEFPVVVPREDGKYRLIAGHHCARAWKALGHETITVHVVDLALSAEEEFNLVNNMNLVRGTVRKTELFRIAREKQLDTAKLQIFKVPGTRFMPAADKSALKQKTEVMARQAEIARLTLRVAREIAAVLLANRDDLTTLLVVDDRLAAVIRLPFASGKAARECAPAIERAFARCLADLFGLEAGREEEPASSPPAGETC